MALILMTFSLSISPTKGNTYTFPICPNKVLLIVKKLSILCALDRWIGKNGRVS